MPQYQETGQVSKTRASNEGERLVGTSFYVLLDAILCNGHCLSGNQNRSFSLWAQKISCKETTNARNFINKNTKKKSDLMASSIQCLILFLPINAFLLQYWIHIFRCWHSMPFNHPLLHCMPKCSLLQQNGSASLYLITMMAMTVFYNFVLLMTWLSRA